MCWSSTPKPPWIVRKPCCSGCFGTAGSMAAPLPRWRRGSSSAMTCLSGTLTGTRLCSVTLRPTRPTWTSPMWRWNRAGSWSCSVARSSSRSGCGMWGIRTITAAIRPPLSCSTHPSTCPAWRSALRRPGATCLVGSPSQCGWTPTATPSRGDRGSRSNRWTPNGPSKSSGASNPVPTIMLGTSWIRGPWCSPSPAPATAWNPLVGHVMCRARRARRCSGWSMRRRSTTAAKTSSPPPGSCKHCWPSTTFTR